MVSFLQVSPICIYFTFLHTCHMPYPSHAPFNLITLIKSGKQCKAQSSSCCSVLQFRATPSLSVLNISLSTPSYFRTPSACGLPLMWHTKLHTHKTTGKTLTDKSQDRMVAGSLTFRDCASCILGQAFHCSTENAFHIFNQQIYFIIWYLLDRASLI